MACIVARTGRHRQRYENNLRLVSGCIPYRVAKDDEDDDSDPENKIQVLMISSPNREDLVFPKGGWDDDETLEEAACREALEEAGVKGILKGNPLGEWEFRSKSSQEICSMEGGCKGYMFAMEVTEELEDWPEQGNRDRKWLCIEEAFKFCRYEWMCNALDKFIRVMTKDRRHETQEEVEVVEESHSVPVVSEMVTEYQILSTNCYVKPSGGQQHNNSSTIDISRPIGASSFWDYTASWHFVVSDSGQGCD